MRQYVSYSPTVLRTKLFKAAQGVQVATEIIVKLTEGSTVPTIKDVTDLIEKGFNQKRVMDAFGGQKPADSERPTLPRGRRRRPARLRL